MIVYHQPRAFFWGPISPLPPVVGPRAAALSSTAHVDTDGLQPSGSEHARQIVKITAAAAGIREQHNRSARTVEGAFERRAADFDVSVLLQSHSPASRLTLGA